MENIGTMEYEDYQHTPLSSESSIRVFDLLPSTDFEAPIRCRLREASFLSAEIEYEALSYVWGSPEATQPVFCHGKRLLVTQNCAEALLHLRYQTQERTLWIDAICIDQNQDDVSARERNHQVREMGQIYAAASRVIVWLGLSIGRTGHLFHYYRRLADSLKSPDIKTLDFREEVSNVGAHPWFSRVWTLQEIAFSREAIVQIGPHALPWHDFAAGLDRTRVTFIASETGLINLRPWITRLVNESRTSGTQVTGSYDAHRELLRLIPMLQCTRDQDRIFGLHSTLTHIGLTLPKPDYSKPISHILQEVVLSFIRCHGKLDPLHLTSPPRWRHDIPSWVPDWLTPSPHYNEFQGRGTFPDYVETGSYKLPSHRASGGSKAEDPGDTTDGTLQSKGKHLGAIRLRLSCEPEGPADQFGPGGQMSFFGICREWFGNLSTLLGNASTRVMKESILCIHQDKLVRGQAIEAWLNALEKVPLTSRFESMTREAFWFQRYYAEYGTHFAFIRVGDNLFGRAHYSCAEGDDVYLLAGSDVPLVLRRNDNNYRVVAPAYIIGAMDGEYWPEDESTLETVTLV